MAEEHKTLEEGQPDNEKYLSLALLEVENGELPPDWSGRLSGASGGV